MTLTPLQQYQALMETIRHRLDLIAALREVVGNDFTRAESAAFHGRKVVEGIAFACLVALDNGFKHVPKDAKGKWNAADIFNSLGKKGLNVFPSPSEFREPTPEEKLQLRVTAVIEGIPSRRLTKDDLISIYERLHRWLHEINPYVAGDQDAFVVNHSATLWRDLLKIDLFMDRHVTSIAGEAFFCVLRDKIDGKTKVGSLTKTV
jgi:hypothetical protein